MDLKQLKQALLEHTKSCNKIGCDLASAEKITFTVHKNAFLHCLTLKFFIVHHAGKMYFKKSFCCFLKCRCPDEFSLSCLKKLALLICEAELKMHYSKLQTVIHENESYSKALLAHHDPFAVECPSLQCMMIGIWKLLVSLQILQKHFCVLREEPLNGLHFSGGAKCRIQLKQFLRGECSCMHPFSEVCFGGLLTKFCK
ncbi:RH5 [Ovine adenovirus 7]|uniref:RH5 n=1 Tax=Ovine adenovirus D serotype 7 (isolate OAV287) TaxID=114430 RepID=Q83917_ADEO7|nr:RH5 [Ovine adenovirus 7]AAD45955.1 RH5 [Ovine adenovirus 7]